MGDFQDVFGAGADAVDIIDGICRAEARYEREAELAAEIIEHLIWFPNYEAAERWEKHHRGTVFTRRKRQGGYEVTVKARRDEADRLQRSEPGFAPKTADAPVTLLYPQGLEDHEVRRGDYCLRLARHTSPLLDEFQHMLRRQLPRGRAGLSPICLPLSDLRTSFHHLSGHLSHEMDLGSGVIAIFCSDHHLLIGRRKGEETQIWPWILEMDCGGGVPKEDGTKGCFLCNHYWDEEILENDVLCRSSLWGGAPESNLHYISKTHYRDEGRPKDLAHCVNEWINLLMRYDPHLSDRRQSPSSVCIEVKNITSYQGQMDHWCKALACAIAMRDGAKDYVEVNFGFDRNPEALSQIQPNTDALCFTQVDQPILLDLRSDAEKEDIPDIDALHFDLSLPKLDALFEYHSSGGTSPGTRSSVKSVLSSEGFSPQRLSSHERVQAMRFATEFLASDLPVDVRQFLGRTMKDRQKVVPT